MSEKKIKKVQKIKKEISQKYDKNPEGWHVSVRRDKENYLNTTFLHQNKFWVIKEFPLNPSKTIGLGSKGKTKDKPKSKKEKEFGLRPLLPNQIKSISQGDSSLVKEILETSPLPFQECSSPLVMEGPVSITKKPVLSEAQQKLDRKLRESLRDLIYRKKPGLSTSYR